MKTKTPNLKLLYGSQNFGYDTPTSDKDWLQFVYPTWDNILTNTIVSKEYSNEDMSITKYKDIRLIPKMIAKANFSDLQFLYSTEVYGCGDLQWFYQNRNDLVHANLKQSFNSNKGFVLACLKNGSDKDLIKAYVYTILIERLFTDETFKLKVNRLADSRTEFVKKIDIDEIHFKLDFYEKIAKNCKKDDAILEQAYLETERLLKTHLLSCKTLKELPHSET